MFVESTFRFECETQYSVMYVHIYTVLLICRLRIMLYSAGPNMDAGLVACVFLCVFLSVSYEFYVFGKGRYI